ncbi:hypothetical protein BD309DRAFT_1015125 [Dichomitus squalens]|uniref:Uncharacterized protein n=1 Tax=Dichomitus squalens TaxID=114155 RepID=A0A4Q9P4G0_9APHY|nr:uncharacterized protein DICSQDRAFT_154065 [Dichomitus squalens LYAD-421 SS1]EJF62805.1 hypothetical protein DICSQDRAFT_154065 [Dichomitus squalens LYAD-421 SS1]TBU49008.1 hypothetical protein BD309DRAFT_1015125 [Dichomitus squalens]TBU64101.1 hypothetical protein BD310DRAFT_944606 [Dichomitus squalens]
MSSARRTSPWATSLFRTLCLLAAVDSTFAAVAITPPATPPSATANVVYSNFLGISLELSFINYYMGNTTDQIPAPFISYLSTLQKHASGKPVRLRLGGNSMDSSTYVPSQPDIVEFTDPNANSNDQPVNYGPQLFDVMKGVSSQVGGAQYLIGLSLRVPNSTNIPLVAGDASKALGDELDAYLLGNEPDLYTGHGQRPYLSNYTTQDYIGDYSVVFNSLKATPQGDVLDEDKIAGPTICCAWNLASVLQSGWFDQYKQQLKYITLQHYPQDTCSGHPHFGIEWYLVHSNTVGLAQWQQDGIQIAKQANKPVLMDEFNSISCGGTDGISNVFGVSLWTTDYALQMAAVGYAGAYLHTRERGVTYNLFDPPAGPAGNAGAWTTNAPYYGMLPVYEALESSSGSRVVDLNVKNGMYDATQVHAAYAIYDGADSTVRSLVVINYKNASGTTSDYAIDPSFIPATNSSITIRTLAAPSVAERTNIAWGGQTWAGVGDGNPVPATFAGSVPDKTIACAGGCTIQVPGPGLAVIFVGNNPANSANATSNNGAHSSSTGASSPTHTTNSGTGRTASGIATVGLFSILVAFLIHLQ